MIYLGGGFSVPRGSLLVLLAVASWGVTVLVLRLVGAL